MLKVRHMVAYEQRESDEGLTEEVAATVQAKGYLNESFQIQTKYQVTLWRWEMMVQGTPADMDWDLYLDSWDRQEQNAYHEFMVVMQADENPRLQPGAPRVVGQRHRSTLVLVGFTQHHEPCCTQP